MTAEKDLGVSDSPFKKAWKRLQTNIPAILGLVIIILSVVIAILGYLIAPDSTPYANEMVLQIGTKPPGYSITFLKVKKGRELPTQNFIQTMLFGKESDYSLIPINGYKYENQYIVINEFIGEGSLGAVQKLELADVIYSLSGSKREVKIINDSLFFVDFLGTKHRTTTSKLRDIIEKKQVIRKSFYLGTDKFGRCILSRMIIGVRVSLSVGFIAVVISLFIGITLGAISGYYRGKIDDIIMWFINVIWSIPTLLLVFAITIALGKGFWQIFVAVGLTMWVEVARIIRGQVMVIREIEFVEAARALGFGNMRIVSRHVLPNVLGPVIVIAAANFASAILIEAGLSFLGIGVQPPMPSWGMMIKEHYGFIIANEPFLAIIPGLAIMIMVLAFNLLGNGFRDALDVKSKMG